MGKERGRAVGTARGWTPGGSRIGLGSVWVGRNRCFGREARQGEGDRDWRSRRWCGVGPGAKLKRFEEMRGLRPDGSDVRSPEI